MDSKKRLVDLLRKTNGMLTNQKSWSEIQEVIEEEIKELVDEENEEIKQLVDEEIDDEIEQLICSNQFDWNKYLEGIANEIDNSMTIKTKTKTPRQCAQCGAQNDNLKKCSKCLNVHYCNKICQKTHWVQHKLECKK